MKDHVMNCYQNKYNNNSKGSGRSSKIDPETISSATCPFSRSHRTPSHAC